MPTSSDLLQYYDQTTIDGHTSLSSSFGFSDSTIATSTTSSPIPNHQSNPNKGLISKPIQRRSRTSKKTPTTLLNANASNFRALVQQFTGCHSKNSSFSGRKGPINLNFQLGSVQNDSTNIGTTGIAPFSNTSTSYDYDQRAEKQFLQHQQVVQQQEQKYMVSSSILDDLFLPSGSSEKETNTTAICNMEIPACELLIDDFSLHELARQSLSCENLDAVYF